MKRNKEEIQRILKYIFSSGTSFLLDIGLFTVLTLLLGKDTKAIFIATILARILSSLYNYFMNSRVVFKNKNKQSFIYYYILVVVQMIISATLVSWIESYIKIFPTFIKIVVDIIIFIVNYIVQKEVIFK